MIKRIIIENFKSIERLDIELAPLTIFVGPNGSGKSSILEAIALMSQALGRNLIDEGRKGPLINIEDRDALFMKRDPTQWLSLGFEIELNEEEIHKISKGISKDIEQFGEREIEGGDLLRQLKEGVEQAERDEKRRKLKYIYKMRLSPSPSCENLYEIAGVKFKISRINSSFSSEPENLRIIGSEYAFFLDGLYLKTIRLNFYDEVRKLLEERLKKVYYLSPERGEIPWYKPAESGKLAYVGRRGELVLEFISTLMKPENDAKRLPYELICREFGIEDVWSGWSEKDILTSNYRDPKLGSTHKFPCLGHGSRQLLPIIAQIAYSEKGSVILIDEPEISLHPDYQIKLHALFGNAIMEGKQILVTTHSSYFPYSLHLAFEGFKLKGQTTRGEREFEIKLSVNKVKVYHVERNKEGYTTVSELELDENGLKEAIPSFSEVEIKLLSRFIEGG